MKKKVSEWIPELVQCPFDQPDFYKLWVSLISSPKWKKKPLSAIEMACKRLKRFDVPFATQLVESAIEGNYQGVVFPDSQNRFEQYKRSLNGSGTHQQMAANAKPGTSEARITAAKNW